MNIFDATKNLSIENKILLKRIKTELINFQVECVLNHVNFDDYEYMTECLELSATEIANYKKDPLAYALNFMDEFTGTACETNEHVDYINSLFNTEFDELYLRDNDWNYINRFTKEELKDYFLDPENYVKITYFN